jgi:FtsP/CotA-like multicopper oxidase with cupredoxin domain
VIKERAVTNNGRALNEKIGQKIGRRDLLRLGGGAAMLAVGATMLSPWSGKVLGQAKAVALNASPRPTIYKHLIATDGWIHQKGASGFWFPDPLAADYTLTADGGGMWGFGFRDVTELDGGPATPTPALTTNPLILAQKNHFQQAAPLLYFDEGDAIQLTLTNMGMAVRPDLTDGHTVHWHGFRNALPAFDGVPEMSTAVPIGRDFPYYYHPTDPGTYMYHCHMEDVEHVQMGMTGIVFVRPAQNRNGATGAPIARGFPGDTYGGAPTAPLGYTYNDGVALTDPRSTAYDREFGIFLSEIWSRARYDGAHIQEHDWSDYHADFFLMNGRTYPDTLAANGGALDTLTGDLIAPAGSPELQYQPISSLIQCNAGDRVLLRFVNLGYTQPAMRLAGIKMHVIGKDATLLRGHGGADTSYYSDTVHVGPGEAYDAIFQAPPKSGSGYDTYLLYSTSMGALTNPGKTGLGGQLTEVRVYAAGTVPAQAAPNE